MILTNVVDKYRQEFARLSDLKSMRHNYTDGSDDRKLLDILIADADKDCRETADFLKRSFGVNGEKIKQAWDRDISKQYRLEDEVAKYTQLTAKGSKGELWGKCPIHKGGQERTASFSVNPAKQSFHCFGCAAKGGIIQFFMAMFDMDFKETIRMMRRKEFPND